MTSKGRVRAAAQPPHNKPTMDKTLIHLLYDEFQGNGGHFQSTEADYMFRQAFAEEFDETATEIFNRLIQTNAQGDSQSPDQ